MPGARPSSKSDTLRIVCMILPGQDTAQSNLETCMQFSVKTAAAESLATPCLVAGVFEGGKLPAATQVLDQASHGYISKLTRSGTIEGRAGQTLMLFDVPKLHAERVLPVGLGVEGDLSLRSYRRAM